MLWNRGKFFRVCLNIDIIKFFFGSVKLDYFGKKVEVFFCYEGLYEICIFCGDGVYDLDNCFIRFSFRFFGMVVEKFGSFFNYFSIDIFVLYLILFEDSFVEGKWVRVIFKRKIKFFFF